VRLRLSAILAAVIVAAYVNAQGPANSPTRVVEAAAQALGGKDRLLAIKTLTIIGYGQLAYQNGGGNIVASPDAPQKWVNVNGSVRAIDFDPRRMRLQETQTHDFVFAYERNMRGVKTDQRLDGDVAFNIGANGRPVLAGAGAARARRLEMLNNPIAIVRAALEPQSKLTNLRVERSAQVLDLTTGSGDGLTVAFDSGTHLPAWVSAIEPNANLGDVTVRTSFVGYQKVDGGGVMMPAGYNSVMDFRNVVQRKLYVDRTVVDGPIEDLAAPADVRAAPPVPSAAPAIEVVPVAKGIWYLKGAGNSTAFEFNDHITLFEAYGSEANAVAIIAKARTLVPGKPVTELIVSHHHFDHSGGLRAAVSEGLKVITQRGNTELFREMTSRPAVVFPDALGRNPKPITIVPVDDTLVLKDSAMEVVVYRAFNNTHMANGVFAYAPAARVVAEGDFVDEAWDIVWWGNSYPDSVKSWKLAVDRDLPVHGNIHTYPEVLQYLRKQAANAVALCDKVQAAGLTMPGCPATNVGF